MDAAVEIFEITGEFPKEERYSLVDQIRRSSRSVCANIAEAWRKRRYRKAFISKLSDAEAEASETQVWLEFAGRFGYLEDDVRGKMELNYDKIIGQIITMISNADKWVIGGKDIE